LLKVSNDYIDLLAAANVGANAACRKLTRNSKKYERLDLQKAAEP
jgi:hypothetical protein